MEQGHIEIVHNRRRSQHSIRIPKTGLEWILVADATPVLQDLVPGEFLALATRDIVDGNAFRPCNRKNVKT